MYLGYQNGKIKFYTEEPLDNFFETNDYTTLIGEVVDE